MAVSKKAARREDRIAELIAEVQNLKARLESIEGSSTSSNGNGHTKAPQSRRDLLKLAGAAVAGAAGTVLLREVPAAATATQPMILGSLSNDTNVTTGTSPTTGSAPSPVFMATGQGVTPAQATVAGTASTTAPLLQSIPLIGAVGAGGPAPPNGPLPPIGSPPVNDYPGFAPIQGVGGMTTVQPTGQPAKTYSEGVNGWGFGATGIGVTGESDTGYGIAGGSGGIDIACLGNGRMLQLSLPGGPTPTDPTAANLLTNSPSGPPNYTPNDFEQVRDELGVIWVSTPGGAWHRLNSPIPITPFRLYDSRPNARPAGSFTDIQVAGQGGVPANAVGVFGNLTAIQPATDGFLTMIPTGQALNQVNTLNYLKGVAAMSNHVMVGLGSGGKVTVFVSQNGPTNFLFDVQGYLI